MTKNRTIRSSRCRLTRSPREVVADLAQRADRVLLHRRVDLVSAELRLLEQSRQPLDRVGAGGQPEQDAPQILERRLARQPAQAVPAEHAFHPRVRRDHGPPRVRLGLEVVDRVDIDATRSSVTVGSALRAGACASSAG